MMCCLEWDSDPRSIMQRFLRPSPLTTRESGAAVAEEDYTHDDVTLLCNVLLLSVLLCKIDSYLERVCGRYSSLVWSCLVCLVWFGLVCLVLSGVVWLKCM